MSFKELGLSPAIIKAVSSQGYTSPTPIQARTIPLILQGKDILAGARTGTGKTAAFSLPVLENLSKSRPNHGRPRALIITPTRELAAQVDHSIKNYGRHLSLRSTVIFGGVNINPQISELKKGIDILVATPGRLIDHSERKTLDLGAVEILILDEADRMLDMGFIRDIKKIMTRLPSKRQNMLFSATYSKEIKGLAKGLLKNPAMVEASRENTTVRKISQKVYQIPQTQKRNLLSTLIREENWQQVLVFTRTKHRANRLTKQLLKDGIQAAAIHGNKSQATRTRVLADFKKGEINTLVATDIAARGLDIEHLPHVVNFDLPQVAQDYIHRIGRTGRAGAKGVALSLVCHEEQGLLKKIETLIKEKIQVETSKKLPPTDLGTKSFQHPPRRQTRPKPRKKASGWL